jgi:hypothetical protein
MRAAMVGTALARFAAQSGKTVQLEPDCQQQL